MARKRMLDPTIWADAGFNKLSPEARLFFIGIISNADDEGRLPGDSLYLTSTIFPYAGYSPQKANALRNEVITRMKSAILYKVGDDEYIWLSKWHNYQSINKPTASKYPPLPKDYRSATVGLPPNRIEENRREEGAPPSLDNKKAHNHISYLQDVPSSDIEVLRRGVRVTPEQIKSKAEDLHNYCRSKNKSYSDYRALLRNAIKRDYPAILEVTPGFTVVK